MGTQGVPHGNLSRVSPPRITPTVAFAPGSILHYGFPDVAHRRCDPKRKLQRLWLTGCAQVTSVYRAHRTRHVISKFNSCSRANLEWALIDTGGATSSRKQLQAYTSKMPGPIGTVRSQILNIIVRHHCFHIISISK